MKSKLTFVLLFLVGFGYSSFAQDTQNSNTGETQQPNLRGNLIFALGLNALGGAPRDFKINSWRSKSVNIYYMYEVPLGNSNFSFHPGVGLGLEKYQFENNTILTYADADDIPEYTGTASRVLIMDSVQNVYGSGTYKKNRLAANYVDVPLEFSYVSNRANPKAGLKVILGGKIGVLYGAHTKIKYEVNNETIKIKDKRQWDLNRFRYSTHARIGYGGFNVYFEYQLSSLFDNDTNGPMHRTLSDDEGFTAPYHTFNDMNNYRIGLAIDLF